MPSYICSVCLSTRIHTVCILENIFQLISKYQYIQNQNKKFELKNWNQFNFESISLIFVSIYSFRTNFFLRDIVLFLIFWLFGQCLIFKISGYFILLKFRDCDLSRYCHTSQIGITTFSQDFAYLTVWYYDAQWNTHQISLCRTVNKHSYLFSHNIYENKIKPIEIITFSVIFRNYIIFVFNLGKSKIGFLLNFIMK